MKIIDLLNKIAKGEEVPKKMFLYNYVWFFNKEEKDYFNSDNTELFGSYLEYAMTTSLNDEVEVMDNEEEKEIRKLPNEIQHPRNFEEVVYIAEDLVRKINELIDVINDMRDKE